ncbi:MAG TPA: DUF2079 domain-containing protein [Ktedonobacterales bacterium]
MDSKKAVKVHSGVELARVWQAQSQRWQQWAAQLSVCLAVIRTAAERNVTPATRAMRRMWQVWLASPIGPLLFWCGQLIRVVAAQSVWRPHFELPPANRGRQAYLAKALLVVGVIIFASYFTAYLFAQQDAFQTHAEDMGIMMQALWTTTHGAILHQTICNPISDANCLGDTSRLAIHVEPIMLPLALIYALAPSAKTLQLVQVVVVAAGAFPAYGLASRRLQSVWAGLAFAALYLLNPALDAAVSFDFHAVTLSAAFLMFAFYYMATKNTHGLVIASVLAMSTKEEVALIIGILGLWIFLWQRRHKLGAGMMLMAVAWLALAIVLMKLNSPIGQTPLAGRYAEFGSSPGAIAIYVLRHPLTVLHDYVLTPDRLHYLDSLSYPLGYAPVLSPLTVLLGGPALLINMLSSKPEMYSGAYQYNAELTPVLVFGAIEGIAMALGIIHAMWRPLTRWLRAHPHALPSGQTALLLTMGRQVLLAVPIILLLMNTGTRQSHDGTLPFSEKFTWPAVTAHSHLGDSLSSLIPASASVSAQADLVPHVSNRHDIYQYPDMAHTADFVMVDVTGYRYPQDLTPNLYCASIEDMLDDSIYGVILAQDGYLIFARNVAAPIPANSQEVRDALQLACE